MLEQQIREAINVFVESRLKLTECRLQLVDTLELGNISISVHSLKHAKRWKQIIQKEVGKEGTFDNDFDKMSNKILADDTFEKYKEFLKKMT